MSVTKALEVLNIKATSMHNLDSKDISHHVSETIKCIMSYWQMFVERLTKWYKTLSTKDLSATDWWETRTKGRYRNFWRHLRWLNRKPNKQSGKHLKWVTKWSGSSWNLYFNVSCLPSENNTPLIHLGQRGIMSGSGGLPISDKQIQFQTRKRKRIKYYKIWTWRNCFV